MNQRLISLDVFRGITIAGMILVNNPGSWSHVYPPFLHAKWHGCTPTDLVFPFFLFIVGVSIVLALSRQVKNGKPLNELRWKITKRSLTLFLLGMFLSGFPHFGIKEIPDATRMIYYALWAGALLAFTGLQIVTQEKSVRTYSADTQRIFRIATLVFTIGIFLVGFSHFDLSHIRIPGVLQRIALVFFTCAMLFLVSNWRTQLYILGGILLIYWALMTLVPIPGGIAPNLEPTTNLGAWLDHFLLENHLWSQSKVWDPEGLLSSLPAIGTGIVGMLTGRWLISEKTPLEKVVGMFVAGSFAIVVGLAWDMVFPINKALWTSSYVLYTGGIALQGLAICYWLIDVKKHQSWTAPAVAYGANAISVFMLSGVVGRLLYLIKVSVDGEAVSLKTFIMDSWFNSWLAPINASLLFAICMVLILFIPMWIFYRQRIVIKV